MFGPQVGLQFRLGGENVSLSGKTTLALLMNNEDQELSGRGVGDPFTDLNYDNTLRFSQDYNTTHLSPAIEQTLNFDMRLFHYIPVLRKMKVMEEARLRVGFTAMLIGEIARPQDQIVWVGQPFQPYLKEERTDWFAYGLNAGIHWKF